MHLFLSTCLYSFHNSVYPCDLRQMDTEQLPNHWEHPSHILDIRETHSVWRDPSERNCNSRRLQRCQFIKSISFWPFYSQKGDWHPSGMAPVHHVPILWLLCFSHGLSTFCCLMGTIGTPLPIAVACSTCHSCKDWALIYWHAPCMLPHVSCEVPGASARHWGPQMSKPLLWIDLNRLLGCWPSSYFILFFWNRISCAPGRPQTWYVAKELPGPPASTTMHTSSIVNWKVWFPLASTVFFLCWECNSGPHVC